ncbi:UDP-N-acetylenolpyruvoylglucosamine reductase [Thermincola ferriacetica]|uniref:UDP-N-acetylenolpyruvoylglucosamine reductase n=1 Tax=Thermincola ferriacetica TaxID=281456 RepID=A0A0L6W5V2_9FIRM|nr:UDP-N-acetylmuramate dehydrogenase [Thermincola ferriacetica]KNZ70469.1 UDP-N-acetylenolpyruvoylglucosamine reductase [Thermincola ferriacetica]
MSICRFREELQNLISGEILVNEPMSLHTTWRIGGPADLMLIPEDIEDCWAAIKLAKKYGIPYLVMGNGSNLLVKDRGIRGLVIKMAAGEIKVDEEQNLIFAPAGTLLPVVARVAADHALSGLEFAVGIPASVGGAIVMNAGAHGKSIGEVVKEVNVLDSDGELLVLPGRDLDFRYRYSNILQKNFIVTKAVFLLARAPAVEIKKRMTEFLEKRRQLQPVGKPNAGSVFKNPAGTSAGMLIDAAGCKGLTVGDAQVSEKHANFILNLDSATAHDVLTLIEQVKNAVYKKFNVMLELEVQVVGE